jgi:aspartyl-tRNA(Asn)/glutamyl-tRNA(Gln) amidotransferase subunit A
VRRAVDAAIEKLRNAGVEIVDVEIPDVEAAMAVFGKLLFGEFVAAFGKARLQAGQSTIDPVSWTRIQAGFGMDAEGLVTAQRVQRNAVATAREMMNSVDALLYPTVPFTAAPAAELQTLDAAFAWNLRSGRVTRPGNFFGQCATSIPVQAHGELPVGLQVICKPGADAKLLAISRMVEQILGCRLQTRP